MNLKFAQGSWQRQYLKCHVSLDNSSRRAGIEAATPCHGGVKWWTRIWANARPMPNVMAALPNIGGAVCSTPQSWLTPTTRVACSNAAKTWKPLKFAGVPQTPEPISATSGLKFAILWGHAEDILLLNKFFSDCRHMPQLWRYSLTKLCNGAQMAIFASFLRPVFPASHVQHISDLHSKFALRPHHV